MTFSAFRKRRAARRQWDTSFRKTQDALASLAEEAIRNPLRRPSKTNLLPLRCTCLRPWMAITPPPPCPVHGNASRWKVVRP